MTATPATDDLDIIESQSSALRMALSVRSWAKPLSILPSDLRPNLRTRVLDAVARDVIVDVRKHPGEWRLRPEARQRVFALRDREQLRAALGAAPPDSVSTTLATLGSSDSFQAAAALAAAGSEDLSVICEVVGWLCDPVVAAKFTEIPPAELADIAQRASGLVSNRARADDVERQLAKTVDIGSVADQVFDALFGPVTSTLRSRVAYVWGPGGAGKSTLVARIEQRAGTLQPPPLVVHFDFDRPTLNPIKGQTLTLDLLRQAGAAHEHLGARAREALTQLSDVVSEQSARPGRAARPRTKNALTSKVHRIVEASEGVSSEMGRAERASVFYDTLRPYGQEGRPLFMILDTIEALEPISAGGAAAMGALQDWLKRVLDTSGIEAMAVLAAGRRPRATVGHAAGSELFEALWFDKFEPVFECLLPELGPDAKRSILEAGQMPSGLIERAASTLPGNPLIVHLAAMTASDPSADIAEIQQALEKGQVDRTTARRYVEERLLRHVPESWARPFIVPAFALPTLTPHLLEHVLIPAVRNPDTGEPPIPKLPARKPRKLKRNVDEETLRIAAERREVRAAAQALFAALSRATWLTETALSRQEATFRPEVVELMSPLIDADPEARAALREVHIAAATFWSTVEDERSNELAAYHAAEAGKLGRTASAPRAVSSAAPGSTDPAPVAPVAVASNVALDAEWRQRFDATALSFLESGELRTIVDRWRERPGNVGSTVPDIVLRALADMGRYDAPEIDLGDVAARMLSSMKPGQTARLQFQGSIADYLSLVVEKASDTFLKDHVLRMIASLNSPLAPRDLDALIAAALLSGLDNSALVGLAEQARRQGALSIRGAVACHLFAGDRDLTASAVQLSVAQANFLDPPPACVEIQSTLSLTMKVSSPATLREVDRHYDRLAGASCALRVVDPGDPELTVLLRASTPELLSPLRYALEDFWVSTGDDSARKQQRARVIVELMDQVWSRMSILPREFEAGMLLNNLDRDLGAWFGAFVGFADRSRLLRVFADKIATARVPDGLTSDEAGLFARLGTVARQVIRWDTALMKGGSSAWRKPASATEDDRAEVGYTPPNRYRPRARWKQKLDSWVKFPPAGAGSWQTDISLYWRWTTVQGMPLFDAWAQLRMHPNNAATSLRRDSLDRGLIPPELFSRVLARSRATTIDPDDDVADVIIHPEPAA